MYGAVAILQGNYALYILLAVRFDLFKFLGNKTVVGLVIDFGFNICLLRVH